MPTWSRDPTGRFSQRPYYRAHEIDDLCEGALLRFYRERLRRQFAPPIDDDTLTALVEAHVGTLDLYADLIGTEGPDVEGLTEFAPGSEPVIKVERTLTTDPRRRPRLRTTLTHELGHVFLHRFLYEDLWKQGSLFASGSERSGRRSVCRRATMLRASATDWAEWQAGYASGALLMPRSAVVQAVQQIRPPTAPLSPVDSLTRELVAAVAERFDVSEEAARVRLEVVGVRDR